MDGLCIATTHDHGRRFAGYWTLRVFQRIERCVALVRVGLVGTGVYRSQGLDAGDHDFGGLHEGCGGLTLAELHLADGVCGDDGGDALVSDG